MQTREMHDAAPRESGGRLVNQARARISGRLSRDSHPSLIVTTSSGASHIRAERLRFSVRLQHGFFGSA